MAFATRSIDIGELRNNVIGLAKAPQRTIGGHETLAPVPAK